ncbi:AraC family transcriptional regulator [Roseomonas sp. HF4]|uniref:helix-turn-helix transcriptional regulator n=1 Tax=Roseomonas sp. HF4 TaxID=2562313 RepID=UPI0010C0F9A0|nr:AraC family transcriptional regulator [Roseomonas sp. HF4]
MTRPDDLSGQCALRDRDAGAAGCGGDTSHQVIISTAGLPARQRFEAWRDLAVPYIDIKPPEDANAGFDATGRALRMGPFLLYAASLPAYDHGRTALRIRRDSLDHWMIAICRRGRQRQRSGDDVVALRPGVPYVLSMACAFEAQRAGAEIDWLALHVPRDAVPDLEPALAAALCKPLEGPTADLLAGFLGHVAGTMDQLGAADMPHVANAAQALLTAALAPCSEAGVAAQARIEPMQLARVKRIIRENIGAATLGPARLCTMAGISRSRLYRLFEPLGGVARHIQRERLRVARRCIEDTADGRSIARIAESVGFFDPSGFSRAFRQEFGCTPREARLAASLGQPQVDDGSLAVAAASRSDVMAMLRRL